MALADSGVVDLRELDPLEQVDFVELARRRWEISFLTHTAQIRAACPSQEVADKLLEAMRSAYFVGYRDEREAQARVGMAELLKMQEASYRLTATKGGGVLEIVRPKGSP